MFKTSQIPGVGWMIIDMDNGNKCISEHKWMSDADRECERLNMEAGARNKYSTCADDEETFTYEIVNIRLGLHYRDSKNIWEAFRQVRSYPLGYGVLRRSSSGEVKMYNRMGILI